MIFSSYTFSTKGKEETIDFRVPIARIEQERREEARLQPGLDYLYTDVPIYDYLKRLSEDGENIADYDTIWYYF